MIVLASQLCGRASARYMKAGNVSGVLKDIGKDAALPIARMFPPWSTAGGAALERMQRRLNRPSNE